MSTFELLVPKVVVQLERARTELADVGVDLADHIPSIVVVGDQSTGKSSLLSALTDLKLPDGNATITRAPLKILIRPGEEKCAKLRYKLRTLSGGVEYKPVALSATELASDPASLANKIIAAQDDMWSSLQLVKEGANPSLWRPYVLGDLEAKYWLLKDDIELTVDVPSVQGPVMVVDLPGLHHPVGRDDFRDELIKFVKDKVSNDNVIILSVMTASLAVAAGDTNLSLAYPLACQADPDFKRTLTIITKADAVHAQDMPAALNAALEKSHTHGCVLVATKSPDGRSEEECLATFKQLYPAERDELERRGGGFGVQCLLQQLVKLQASMVQQLDIPALIYKLQGRLADVEENLKEFGSLPDNDREADDRVDKLLRMVEHRFRDACRNAAFKIPGETVTAGMINEVHVAASSYVGKQSDFIPGILGRKSVLQIILDAARQDEQINHPDILSEYTAINLFLEFHNEAVSHGLEYVTAVHEAVLRTITGLLHFYLKDHAQLATAAVAAATQLVREAVKPLKEAVKDVALAYTYVVEPLHDQVLYMTYHRLLMIASGILVNEYDMQQAKKLHDKDGSNGKITPTPQNLDSSGDAPPRKGLDQVFPGTPAGGFASGAYAAGSSSATGAIVGGTVGALTTVALAPFLGPFAAVLGPSATVLSAQAWELTRRLLLKYREDYNAKKSSSNRNKFAGFKTDAFQEDLEPLSWPTDTDPMTSFELMCRMMNCDPSYVVQALDFYYKAFDKSVRDNKAGRKYGALDLQRQFIACLCRMLCSHYAMTESVAKLVRLRLMCTHPHGEDAHSAESMAKCSLPNILGVSLLNRLRAAHPGGMLRLVAGEERAAQKMELQQKRDGVLAALGHLKAACQ